MLHPVELSDNSHHMMIVVTTGSITDAILRTTSARNIIKHILKNIRCTSVIISLAFPTEERDENVMRHTLHSSSLRWLYCLLFLSFFFFLSSFRFNYQERGFLPLTEAESISNEMMCLKLQKKTLGALFAGKIHPE